MLLRIAALWIALMIAGAGWAQSPAGFSLEQFNKLAQSAEEVVDKGEAATPALEELRSRLSEFRSAALAEQDRHRKRIATVTQQLDALGPAPAEGETESDEVATRRAELRTALAEAQAPALAAQEAYSRADGLMGEIDIIIRSRLTNELLQLDETPLAPTRWLPAVQSFGAAFVTAKDEVKAGISSQTTWASFLQKLPLIALLSAVGLFLLTRSRYLTWRLMNSVPPATNRIWALVQFVLSLGHLFLPIAGLFILVYALSETALIGPRGLILLNAVPYAGSLTLITLWVSKTLFAIRSDNQTFLGAATERVSTGKNATILLAYVLGLLVFLGTIAPRLDLSQGHHAVLSFPLIVLGGLGLLRLGTQMRAYVGGITDSVDQKPLVHRLMQLLRLLAIGAGVLGPVLAAIGYFNAGRLLIVSTILTLVVIASVFILFRLLVRLTQPLSEIHDQPSPSRLLNVLIGFVLICAALPILALIWGARVSDLKEFWIWMSDGVSIGDTRISFTDFLTFIFIFMIGYTITRLLQTSLRTVVLPNTKLDAGGKNAIVTMTGYVGIVIAALAAIGATGLNLSNLAIVAGALSVGIGFGLQAIVSNFVSGIILLIERPIKQGDWIDAGGYSGYVSEISVRSTRVDTFDRATVIIPNADLIAGAVTNWTHGSMSGRVIVPVGVGYDSDPRKVEKILLEIAEAHPMVLREPSPNVVFIGFGADSMNFEIRAILRDVNWMMSARSDMNFEIVRRFREEGIEIPFAQRDIKLRNIDDLAKAIKGGPYEPPVS